MELDKVHQSLTYSSNDITMLTKQTSNVSNSYTEDFYPNLNLSFSQSAETKFRSNDYPVLKRSQSHKRHHFNLYIGTIVNEELNEDDSENMTSIKSNQCSFSSDQSDIEIISRFDLNNKYKDDLSPKTQLTIANLHMNNNNTIQKSFENYNEEEWNNRVSPYEQHSLFNQVALNVNNIFDKEDLLFLDCNQVLGKLSKEDHNK